MDKSKFALSNALLSLMREKPYEKISIQDIVRRAYVSRTTFYNHFSDKDAIIRCLLEDIFQPLLRMDATHSNADFRQYLVRYVSILTQSRELFLLMRQSGIINMASDFMSEQIQRKAAENSRFETFFGSDANTKLFSEYESRLTFFSVFWFLNHESIRSHETLANIIYDTRKIGYRESSPAQAYQALGNGPQGLYGKGDARALHTKNALYGALNTLLANRPLNEITISDLTEAAGVSRCSFYRHYSTMEQLIEELLQWIYKDVIQSLPSEGHLIGYASIMRISLKGYEKYRAIFSAVTGTDYEMTALRAYRSVFDVLIQQLPYIQSYIPTDAYALEYYHWFIALEHIVPVMIYFNQETNMSIDAFSEFMRTCRYFPYRLADLRKENQRLMMN